MQRHTRTSHLENKNKRSFLVGSGGWEAKACNTARSIARIFLGVVFNVSHLYVFVANLIACRLDFITSAVACRPVTPRLWSGFLVWPLYTVPFLLAGWYEGFYGV